MMPNVMLSSVSLWEHPAKQVVTNSNGFESSLLDKIFDLEMRVKLQGILETSGSTQKEGLEMGY